MADPVLSRVDPFLNKIRQREEKKIPVSFDSSLFSELDKSSLFSELDTAREEELLLLETELHVTSKSRIHFTTKEYDIGVRGRPRIGAQTHNPALLLLWVVSSTEYASLPKITEATAVLREVLLN